MKAKIGAYCRVSTKEQDTSAQRHAIREWARANHVSASEVKWFEDKKSGATADRPELQRLTWSIDHGRIDTLVVFRLDRLARNTTDGLRILATLADRGIRVVSVSENIDFGSATGKLIASILLSVATWERETIVSRIKSGMDAARANGNHVGRPRDEKKLQQVRRLKDGGLSVIQIADKLEITRQAVYQALAKTAN